MDLTPYIDTLRQELADAAATGGEQARALAERLSAPLASAARLALLEALSAAAADITRDLAPGSVDLRLRGREPTFVVTPPPADRWFDEPGADPAGPPPAPAPAETDDGPAARINVRLPEHLKARIEEAAGRSGLSINSWLVRAATAALEPAGTADSRRAGRGGQRYTGWVR